MKGFYPAGSAEISDAVQAAIKTHSPGRVLVPISNWAAFGGSKEVIVWMPIDMIAQTITSVIAVRKQIIEDIYQIMGLSDIMRGATDPGETLGAQQLKSQYGSVRIRDKQGEMVRVARDIEEITAEIMCSDFDFETLMEMSQMEIPTEAEQQQKIMALQQQMQAMTMQAQQQMQQAQVAPQAQADGGAAEPRASSSSLSSSSCNSRATLRTSRQQADARAGRAVPQGLPHHCVRPRHRDGQHHPSQRGRRETKTRRVHGHAGAAAAAACGAHCAGAGRCRVRRRDCSSSAVAPFRVGRSLDGSMDNLVEQVEAKAAEKIGKPDPKLEAGAEEGRGDGADRDAEAATGEGQARQPAADGDGEAASRPISWRRRSCKASSGSRCSRRRPRKRRTWRRCSRRKPRWRRWTQQKHQQSLVESNQKMALQTQIAAAEADGRAEPSSRHGAAAADERAQSGVQGEAGGNETLSNGEEWLMSGPRQSGSRKRSPRQTACACTSISICRAGRRDGNRTPSAMPTRSCTSTLPDGASTATDKPEVYECQDELQKNSPLIYEAWLTVREKIFAGHRLVRCYANAMCYGMDGTVHTDATEPGNYTAVYYPHERWSPNWGGETMFYNQREDRVMGCFYPRPNSCVVFDGRIPHRANGVTRSYAGIRIVLSFQDGETRCRCTTISVTTLPTRSWQQQGASTFDYGLAGLGSAAPADVAHDRTNACRHCRRRQQAACRVQGIGTGWSVNSAAAAAANRHAGRDADDGRAWAGAGTCKGTGTGRHAAAGAAAQTTGAMPY